MELNNLKGLQPRGKKIMDSRKPIIENILKENNCIMNWDKNTKGYLFVLSFSDGREKIEKQFDKKPYNIYHKVNLFFDYVEEIFKD